MKSAYVKSVIVDEIVENSYVSTLPIVNYLRGEGSLKFNTPVTFFAGENGTGKSTLIEAIAIACGFDEEGGPKNLNFTTLESTANLHKYLTIEKNNQEEDGFFLRAESFYNVAADVLNSGADFEVDHEKSFHAQSHGEGLLSLIKYRFRENGLYIFDEPESALSPSSQLAMLSELKRLVDLNCQLIIATHSPILLSFPGATIYQTSDAGIEKVEYEQCDHYILTREFLNNYKVFLEDLFD